MPKHIPTNELDAVFHAVSLHPTGASLDEIADSLKILFPRRTLQRRLALLVKAGRLRVQGRGRATRYLPVHGIELRGTLPTLEGHLEAEMYVPVSPEGQAVKQYVRQPLHQRRPVGYDRYFLDAYRPNETFYLPADVREALQNQSRGQVADQPAGTFARKILDRILIDLSWNSSRLEGNTYSLLETERLLQLGEAAVGKNAFETQMIINHKAAIKLLVEHAGEAGFNRHTLLNLHALLADNLLSDPQACGRLRAIPVGIEGSVYHPLEIPQLVNECFQQILHTAQGIEDPFEQSFFMLVHVPYLQPFEDVNKRVSRLCANIGFINRNLSPLSFTDVPGRAYRDAVLGVYELNRVELLRDVFIWAYGRSCERYAAVCRSLGVPDPFRMRHRELITRVVYEIVQRRMNKIDAVAFIRRNADALSPDQRQRFVEVVETELIGLHEGNIARHGVRLSEYQAWVAHWL
jgi:hypothetical protein